MYTIYKSKEDIRQNIIIFSTDIKQNCGVVSENLSMMSSH